MEQWAAGPSQKNDQSEFIDIQHFDKEAHAKMIFIA